MKILAQLTKQLSELGPNSNIDKHYFYEISKSIIQIISLYPQHFVNDDIVRFIIFFNKDFDFNDWTAQALDEIDNSSLSHTYKDLTDGPELKASSILKSLIAHAREKITVSPTLNHSKTEKVYSGKAYSPHIFSDVFKEEIICYKKCSEEYKADISEKLSVYEAKFLHIIANDHWKKIFLTSNIKESKQIAVSFKNFDQLFGQVCLRALNYTKSPEWLTNTWDLYHAAYQFIKPTFKKDNDILETFLYRCLQLLTAYQGKLFQYEWENQIPICHWLQHQNNEIQLLKKFYTQNNAPPHARLIDHSNRVRTILSNHYKQAERLLGAPPCAYLPIGLSSMARQEMQACSDIEHILLVENLSLNTYFYFSQLIRIIEFQLMSYAKPDCEGLQMDDGMLLQLTPYSLKVETYSSQEQFTISFRQWLTTEKKLNRKDFLLAYIRSDKPTWLLYAPTVAEENKIRLQLQSDKLIEVQIASDKNAYLFNCNQHLFLQALTTELDNLQQGEIPPQKNQELLYIIICCCISLNPETKALLPRNVGASIQNIAKQLAANPKLADESDKAKLAYSLLEGKPIFSSLMPQQNTLWSEYIRFTEQHASNHSDKLKMVKSILNANALQLKGNVNIKKRDTEIKALFIKPLTHWVRLLAYHINPTYFSPKNTNLSTFNLIKLLENDGKISKPFAQWLLQLLSISYDIKAIEHRFFHSSRTKQNNSLLTEKCAAEEKLITLIQEYLYIPSPKNNLENNTHSVLSSLYKLILNEINHSDGPLQGIYSGVPSYLLPIPLDLMTYTLKLSPSGHLQSKQKRTEWNNSLQFYTQKYLLEISRHKSEALTQKIEIFIYLIYQHLNVNDRVHLCNQIVKLANKSGIFNQQTIQVFLNKLLYFPDKAGFRIAIHGGKLWPNNEAFEWQNQIRAIGLSKNEWQLELTNSLYPNKKIPRLPLTILGIYKRDDQRYLHPEIIQLLVDKAIVDQYGNYRPTIKNSHYVQNMPGRSPVIKYIGKIGQQEINLYLKIFPELPLNEYFAKIITNRLTNTGMPWVALSKITATDGKSSTPILISETIIGLSLDKFIKSNIKQPKIVEDKLASLDSYSFSQHVFRSIVLNDEDSHPQDVFIVDNHLATIDNERILLPSYFYKNGQLQRLTKNTAYVLSMMQKPIHLSAKFEFIQLSTYQILRASLTEYQQLLDQLESELYFTQKEISVWYPKEKNFLMKIIKRSTLANPDKISVLTPTISRQNLSELYFRLSRLIINLQNSKYKTLLQLLTSVQPTLGKEHKEYFAENPDNTPRRIQKGITSYYQKQANENSKGNFRTQYNTQEILQTGSGKIIKSNAGELWIEKQNLLAELLTIDQIFQQQNTILNKIYAAEPDVLLQLKVLLADPYARILARLDFNKISSTDNEVNLHFQSKIIKLISNLPRILNKLNLLNCSALTDSYFRSLYINQAGLREIILQNTTKTDVLLQLKSIKISQQRLLYLQKLTIINCHSLTNLTIKNSSLRLLKLVNNSNLELLSLETSNLMRLYCAESPNITNLNVFAPNANNIYFDSLKNFNNLDKININAKQLKNLAICKSPALTIVSISQKHFPKLEKLVLANNQSLKSVSLKFLNLESLDLLNSSFDEFNKCYLALELLINNPKLTQLKLWDTHLPVKRSKKTIELEILTKNPKVRTGKIGLAITKANAQNNDAIDTSTLDLFSFISFHLKQFIPITVTIPIKVVIDSFQAPPLEKEIFKHFHQSLIELNNIIAQNMQQQPEDIQLHCQNILKLNKLHENSFAYFSQNFQEVNYAYNRAIQNHGSLVANFKDTNSRGTIGSPYTYGEGVTQIDIYYPFTSLSHLNIDMYSIINKFPKVLSQQNKVTRNHYLNFLKKLLTYSVSFINQCYETYKKATSFSPYRHYDVTVVNILSKLNQECAYEKISNTLINILANFPHLYQGHNINVMYVHTNILNSLLSLTSKSIGEISPDLIINNSELSNEIINILTKYISYSDYLIFTNALRALVLLAPSRNAKISSIIADRLLSDEDNTIDKNEVINTLSKFNDSASLIEILIHGNKYTSKSAKEALLKLDLSPTFFDALNQKINGSIVGDKLFLQFETCQIIIELITNLKSSSASLNKSLITLFKTITLNYIIPREHNKNWLELITENFYPLLLKNKLPVTEILRTCIKFFLDKNAHACLEYTRLLVKSGIVNNELIDILISGIQFNLNKSRYACLEFTEMLIKVGASRDKVFGALFKAYITYKTYFKLNYSEPQKNLGYQFLNLLTNSNVAFQFLEKKSKSNDKEISTYAILLTIKASRFYIPQQDKAKPTPFYKTEKELFDFLLPFLPHKIAKVQKAAQLHLIAAFSPDKPKLYKQLLDKLIQKLSSTDLLLKKQITTFLIEMLPFSFYLQVSDYLKYTLHGAYENHKEDEITSLANNAVNILIKTLMVETTKPNKVVASHCHKIIAGIYSLDKEASKHYFGSDNPKLSRHIATQILKRLDKKSLYNINQTSKSLHQLVENFKVKTQSSRPKTFSNSLAEIACPIM